MKKKKKDESSPVTQIIQREHGRYLIKAGMLQNVFVARAFPKPPSRFRHLVAEAKGDTAEDAIAHLIKELEVLRSARRSRRRADPALPSGVPTTEEYADALRGLSPGPRLLAVLHDHALSGRRGSDLKELAVTGEFASVQDLLNAYEKLGTDVAAVVEPDEHFKTGLPVVINIPLDNDGLPPKGVATLQPELQEALLHLLGSDRRAS